MNVKKRVNRRYLILTVCLLLTILHFPPARANEPALLIPRGVTEIGDEAFRNAVSLDHVVIPDTVRRIGEHAFAGSDLIHITVPSSVKEIAENAFEGCENFSVSAPAGSYAESWFISHRAARVEPLAESADAGQFTFREIGGTGNRAITGYLGTATDIVIPTATPDGDPVTTIDRYAFRDSGITSVIIPEGITEISDRAFLNAENLSGPIVLPSTLKLLGTNAFLNCKIDGIVYVPKGVTVPSNLEKQMGNGTDPCAWQQYTVLEDGCVSLGAIKGTVAAHIDIPGYLNGRKVVSIGSAAFSAVQTDSVTVPGTVRTIGQHAFSRCSLKSISLPETLTGIGTGAFFLSGLTGVVELPKGIRHLAREVFAYCTGITEIRLPEGLLTIGDEAFRDCSSLASVQFPDSLETIGYGAFSRCYGLTGDLVFSPHVKAIGPSAFSQCTRLTALHFPKELQTIGDSAFQQCDGLTGTLAFGEGLISIGDSAFAFCGGITGLTFASAEKLETIGAEAFRDCTSLTGALYFEKGLRRIGNYAFNGCEALTGPLSFSDGLLYIGDYAFSGCPGMASELKLPDSLEVIGSCAFAYTSVSGEVHFPQNLIFIGSSAFAHSGISGSLSFGPNLETIGEDCFSQCEKLTGTVSFESVKRIEEGAFAGLKLQGSLKLPEGLEFIGGSAFYNTSFTGALILPDSVTEIGSSAFVGGSYSGRLHLPENLIKIGIGAFSGLEELTGPLSLPRNLTRIGYGAFRGCSGLTGNLIIPEHITVIEKETFSKCTGMTGSLWLPDGLEEIGDRAFYQCGFSGTLTLPAGLRMIGEYAFCENSGLTGDLILPDNARFLKYAFAKTGFTGRLVLPKNYEGSTDNSGWEGAFSDTGFTSLYTGPYMTELHDFQVGDYHGYPGPFSGIKGPIPVYRANPDMKLTFFTHHFSEEQVYDTNYYGSTDTRLPETVPSNYPHLSLSCRAEPSGEDDIWLLSVTLTNKGDSYNENLPTIIAKAPRIEIRTDGTYTTAFEYDADHPAVQSGIRCRDLDFDESDTVVLRVSDQRGFLRGLLPLSPKMKIIISASAGDGQYLASKEYTFEPTDRHHKLQQYNETNSTYDFRFDCKQILDHENGFSDRKVSVEGDLLVRSDTRWIQSTLEVQGDLIISDGACMSIGEDSDIRVNGNVLVRDGTLNVTGGSLTVSSRKVLGVEVGGKLEISRDGAMKMSGGSVQTDTFLFLSSSKASTLSSGSVRVMETADLSGHFRADAGLTLRLSGRKLRSDKGASAGTLVIDHDLKDLDWTKGISSFLSAAKLVTTSEALKTLEEDAKSLVGILGDLFGDVAGLADDKLSPESIWQLTLKTLLPGGQSKAEWDQYAYTALQEWSKAAADQENLKVNTLQDFLKNLQSANREYSSSSLKNKEGRRFSATVKPLGAMNIGESVPAGCGTLHLILPDGKQLDYIFSMTKKGGNQAYGAWLGEVRKEYCKQLNDSMSKALKGTPFIGTYVSAAYKIYASALFENKSLYQIAGAVCGTASAAKMEKLFSGLKEYLELYQDLHTFAENAKSVSKLWGGSKESGFAVDEARVKDGLDLVEKIIRAE